MELDSIMMWVANEESYYNRVMRMYDKWVDEGDSWTEKHARREAERLIHEIAEAIQENQAEASDNEKYTKTAIQEAVDETLEDFEDYREEEIAERAKNAKRQARPEDWVMDDADKAYAARMEEMLKKMAGLGYDLDMLRGYMPVSQAKVRQALERGDKHLNTIKLRKWDEQAEMLGRPWAGFSLSDGVGILKHVAKWHYA